MYLLVVVLLLRNGIPTRLECLDLRLDSLLALSMCKTMCLEFERLRFPVFLFFCRLEIGVFADGGVAILVDLFKVF